MKAALAGQAAGKDKEVTPTVDLLLGLRADLLDIAAEAGLERDGVEVLFQVRSAGRCFPISEKDGTSSQFIAGVRLRGQTRRSDAPVLHAGLSRRWKGGRCVPHKEKGAFHHLQVIFTFVRGTGDELLFRVVDGRNWLRKENTTYFEHCTFYHTSQTMQIDSSGCTHLLGEATNHRNRMIDGHFVGRCPVKRCHEGSAR